MSKVILLSDISCFSSFSGDLRYIGPYVLASQLREKNISTTVIDYFSKHPDFFAYLKRFLTKDTRLIGISSTFLGYEKFPGIFDFKYLWHKDQDSLFSWFKSLRKILNEICPQARIVVGGAQSKYLFTKELEQLGNVVDGVFINHADKSIYDYYLTILNPDKPSINQIEYSGINFIDNRDRLNEKTVVSTEFTHQDAVQFGEALPIEISRGCRFNCKFCEYEKNSSSLKDPALLKENLIYHYENFGTTVFQFCDDCFNDSRKKIESVCNVLLGLPFKIEWVSYARVDLAVRFPETMKLMIDSGAKGLFFGIESLNTVVARKTGKGTPIEKVKNFLLEFKEKYSHKCLVTCSFISGLPLESIESVKEGFDWVIENRPFDFIHISPLLLSEKKTDELFDNSAYTSNPAQYGFRKVSFEPIYWEHDHMNFHQALEIANHYREKWNQGNSSSDIIRSIWQYPFLRSLGYSEEEVFNFARGPANKDSSLDVQFRYQQYLKNYWHSLEQFNGSRLSSRRSGPQQDLS